ncbi:MAG: hypothetical protein E7294_16040 [Lachnospiraceae bacterium]|nr:hypothetical protein [Lachnospiraceae bacterium]
MREKGRIQSLSGHDDVTHLHTDTYGGTIGEWQILLTLTSYDWIRGKNMNYSKISEEMTVSDLVSNKSYGVFRDFIFTYMTPDHYNRKLSEYGFEKVGFEEGLHRMEELAASDGMNGESFLHDVYPESEQKEQWDKAFAKYLHFPAKTQNSEPTPYVNRLSVSFTALIHKVF